VTFRDGTEVLPASSPDLAAVIDLDIRPNQECSDTILRLRAEYLRWAKREAEIRFELSGGGTIAWPEWKRGMRPREVGGSLSFHRTAGPDASRHSFERFLDTVFAWCGTYSLASEGKPVSPSDVRIGDFFVHGGSPGHAVLIVDMAADALGARKGLLLQGYMPAQSAHVLARDGEPWFDLDPDQPLDTPLWGAFDWTEVRRFDAE